MKYFIFLLSFEICFACSQIFAADDHQSFVTPVQKSFKIEAQMVKDLEFISNLFTVSYAPGEWKKSQLNWDIFEETEMIKQQILSNKISIKEYQHLLKHFLLKVCDYHVLPRFYSTEASFLPFQLESAQEKYFVTDKNYQKGCPLEIGDQIISIDKIPIGEMIQNFSENEIGRNTPGTDQALAEFYFTNRFGSLGHTICQGPVTIVYQKPFKQKREHCKCSWDYHHEKVSDFNVEKFLGGHNFYRRPFMTLHQNFLQMRKAGPPMEMLGRKKSKLPPLGFVLWETEPESAFYAYLFLMDDGKVGGYLRIPTYNVDNSEENVQEFSEIIEMFQEASEVLVIDQMNNGGGLLFYLYALLSMLTDKPLEIPQHRLKITQEDVYFSAKHSQYLQNIKNDRTARKKLGGLFEGLFVDCQFAQNLLKSHQFIIEQWQLGNQFTDYCYVYGIERIKPHPEVQYTKPILVLINHLCFSAADFFPAIIQDNQRGIIMGTRTAGAGGYIENVHFPNLTGIQEIGITASFAMRPTGNPIENLGVSPDILYEVTSNDLQNNYVDYKRNILKQLKLMLFSSYLNN